MLFEGVKKRALRSIKSGCNIKEGIALKETIVLMNFKTG